MKLSVVILNYNVCFFLEQCIKCVQEATKGIHSEIIVVDNISKDGSCEMVKKLFPEVQLIENKENIGFSKANNQGVALAKGEYICILNPDTAVSEDTFVKCINFSESTNKIGALGVCLIDGTGNFLPESKRNIPTPKVSLKKLLGLSKKYYANHIDEKSIGEKVKVLVGAFMFIKRSIYIEVGGFDEDYFMYGEDIDISFKITKSGYSNFYLGTTTVLHYKGESTKRDAAYLSRFYGAMHIFYKKHFAANRIVNLIVKFMVEVVKVYKKLSKAKTNKTHFAIEKAVVLTENLNLLKQLSGKFKAPISSASKAMFQDTLHSNTLFIFDADYMPYAQIFDVMEKLKNRGNQFKIYPFNSTFIIGSNQSDEKGDVTVF